MKLIKFPYIILWVIFAGTTTAFLFLFYHLFYSGFNLQFTPFTFWFYSIGLCLFQFACGVMWMGSQKAWTMEDMIDRIANLRKCNQAIDMMKRHADFLKENGKL